MGIPKDLLRKYKYLRDWSILTAYRGSLTHGMYMPSKEKDSIDDIDVIAVCVLPFEHYVGLKEYMGKGTKEIKHNEWDIVIHELRKTFSLLKKGNPNILSLLCLEKNHYIKKTSVGQKLIDNRDLFVGRHVYHSFTGYAYGQLHRMTNMAFEGYMGEKRKRLVEKYGYDTKNAAHLIRLLRMGIEFLNEGRLYVMRKDAQQLLEIKRGNWTLEQVKKEADYLFKRAEQAYDNCILPNKLDDEKINDLCMELMIERLLF